MRIAAICLPELRVELVRASGEGEGTGPGEPLAIVVAPEPLTEAKLLGNTRLDVVSAEARALGVLPGQTIASARARASSLVVRVVRPDAVRGVLARLAEVALAFGATVSFATASDAVDSAGDVVWVDVTGCAHLHAPDRGRAGERGERSDDGEARDVRSEGEMVLGSRLAQVFAGLGHTCAVAIADGPRIAAIVARVAAGARAAAIAASTMQTVRSMRDRRLQHNRADDGLAVVVVPPGKNAAAMAPLPVSVLPLSPDEVRWLSKVGVSTIAELRALPRSALATRLGSRAAVVLCLSEGDDRAPLTAYTPPEIPEEGTTFEYGVEGAEALTFVAKMLADRLAARLAGRAVAASRLELDLALDVALLRSQDGDASERVQRIAVELPQPLSSAADLLAALRPKIERVTLRAPVLGAKLRAASLVRKPQAALSLFEPQPKAERALPRLVAELASDLGETAVGKLALGDAWLPEDRSLFVRLGAGTAAQAKPRGRGPTDRTQLRRHMLASVPEPTRILTEPQPVSRDAVKIVRHLSRLEAVDWWKHLPGEGPKKGVDYVHAWVDDGAAWVEIDRASGAARVRGWFD
ncbi:MAG: polymerase IV-like protein ImuB [Labilithrix sp.]|nr:polymerase IV-like protein ImuB [Labilithrix sp.]